MTAGRLAFSLLAVATVAASPRLAGAEPLIPPPHSAHDFHCAAPMGAADASPTIQDCINRTADGGRVWLPAGGYSVNHPVFLSRAISLVGARGTAILRASRHAAGVRFPDIINRSHLVDVAVDFSPALAAKDRIDFLDYPLPKFTTVARTGQEQITYHVVPERNLLFKVKWLMPNRFILFRWDERFVYLHIDQSQTPPYSLGTNDGRFMHRFPRVGDKILVNTRLQWYRQDSCSRTSVGPYTFQQSLISHSVMPLGGDAGWSDVVTLGYRHGVPQEVKHLCRGAVDELFDYSSTWGHVQWRLVCVSQNKAMNGKLLLHSYNNAIDPNQNNVTHPNLGLICNPLPR